MTDQEKTVQQDTTQEQTLPKDQLKQLVIFAVILCLAAVWGVQNPRTALRIMAVLLGFGGIVMIHELGHFILAKKFGVKVEEFGLGYPPRLFGKKIGETVYSINLLPFGAFVKIYGEESRINDPRSFSSKPFWEKALIVLGGVISFWIVAVIILSIIMGIGAPTIIGDEEDHNFSSNAFFRFSGKPRLSPYLPNFQAMWSFVPWYSSVILYLARTFFASLISNLSTIFDNSSYFSSLLTG